MRMFKDRQQQARYTRHPPNRTFSPSPALPIIIRRGGGVDVKSWQPSFSPPRKKKGGPGANSPS